MRFFCVIFLFDLNNFDTPQEEEIEIIEEEVEVEPPPPMFSEDELEVHIEFTDPIELGNYYLFKFKKRGELLPNLEVGDDEFVNGNEIDWWYEIEEDESTDKIEAFKAGDVVDIEMYAISEAYKNYISILIDQIGGVGLFEATPIAVKGNCINENNQVVGFGTTSYLTDTIETEIAKCDSISLADEPPWSVSINIALNGATS